MKNFVLKAVALLAIVMVVGYGCSKDDATSKTESIQSMSKIKDDDLSKAKYLYIQMMNTYEYDAYYQSMRLFANKLKDNTHFEKNKDDYFTWMSQNLSSTYFSSMEEFATMYEDMVSKYSNLINKNQELFSYLHDADSNQFIEIVQPSAGPDPIVNETSDCVDNCLSDWDNAMNGLDWARANNFGQTFGQHAALVEALYWSSYSFWLLQFNNCMIPCY